MTEQQYSDLHVLATSFILYNYDLNVISADEIARDILHNGYFESAEVEGYIIISIDDILEANKN